MAFVVDRQSFSAVLICFGPLIGAEYYAPINAEYYVSKQLLITHQVDIKTWL